MNDHSPPPPPPRRSPSRSFTMRFDKLRRRVAPPPTPPPPTPLPASHRSTSDWFDRDNSNCTTPPPQSPSRMTRQAYIRALQARMDQLERVPTRSFFNSYAGEFDMLQGEDRRAVRREREFETSLKAENAMRNRYANVLSNEPTRVKLKDVAPNENDYINANLVRGYGSHPGYVATQAPLPETMPHFWQMVYESVSPVIIMLTREQEDNCAMTKSEKYWPNVGEDLLFDHYLVSGVEESHALPGIIERKFRVARVVDSRKKHARNLVDVDSMIPHTEGTVWHTPARGKAHFHWDDDDYDCGDNEELMRHLEAIGHVLDVTQLQYLDWPDQEVPENPNNLLDLCAHVDDLSKTRYLRNRIHAPPIVHCSAGVGRTGTFIAVDVTLRRLWAAFSHPSGDSLEPVCVREIRDLVRKLKNERSKMVQTAEQYKFIYVAVLAGLRRWENGQLIFKDSEKQEGPEKYDSHSEESPMNGLAPVQSTVSSHSVSANEMQSE